MVLGNLLQHLADVGHQLLRFILIGNQLIALATGLGGSGLVLLGIGLFLSSDEVADALADASDTASQARPALEFGKGRLAELAEIGRLLVKTLDLGRIPCCCVNISGAV